MADFIENIKLPDGTSWKIKGLPSGGTIGQVLTKASNNDADAAWQTPTDTSVFALKTELSSGLDTKANASTTYSKDEVDTKIEDIDFTPYALKENTYTKEEINVLTNVDLSAYYTKNDVNGLLIQKADVSAIPTVPTEVSAFNNDAGYLTEHQDISNLATKQELSDAIAAIPETDLTDYVTNDALNAKGYITSVPAEYVTETELNAKNYLTQHQDISGKADKSTTLAGYGITNAYTKAEVDAKLGDIDTILDSILGA